MEEKILYICDRKKCENCHDYCKHTEDINHAVNFEKKGSHYYESDKFNILLDEIKKLKVK